MKAPTVIVGGGLLAYKVNRPTPIWGWGGTPLTESWRLTAQTGGHAYTSLAAMELLSIENSSSEGLRDASRFTVPGRVQTQGHDQKTVGECLPIHSPTGYSPAAGQSAPTYEPREKPQG